MGDLKVNENFVDRVFITHNTTGIGAAGLTPTCTIIDESDNRAAGTVAEMANGWYKITDFTPNAAGTWSLEWAVSGGYTVHGAAKIFKVGGGRTEDLNTNVGDPSGDTLITLTAKLGDTANAIAPQVDAIKAKTDNLPTDPADDSDLDSQLVTLLSFLTNGTGNPLEEDKSLKDKIDDLLTLLTFQVQTEAALAQANPVQNTWYTVLDTTLNAKLFFVTAQIATTGEDINMKITIDGLTYTVSSVAFTAGTLYDAQIRAGNSAIFTATRPTPVFSGGFEGRSVKVEIRKTTANGAGNLNSWVTYAARSTS